MPHRQLVPGAAKWDKLQQRTVSLVTMYDRNRPHHRPILPAMTFDSIGEIVLRLSVATIVGGLIGLNRELKHKPAGLRTHALVALGAAIVTTLMVGTTAGAGPAQIDALSRVVQGIITGIGFLGAGVILRTESGHGVHGLTTAASIWLAACLGCACGAGAWVITACAFVLVMLILIVGGPIEHWILKKLSHGRPPDPVDLEI